MINYFVAKIEVLCDGSSVFPGEPLVDRSFLFLEREYLDPI